MLTALIIVCVCSAALLTCWWILVNTLHRIIDWWRGGFLRLNEANDDLDDQLRTQRARFDDLVARNARNYTSPIRGAKAVDTQGAWSVYATLQSGADQLIARFDTPDPEYNRILAEDLREKLNEKPV